MTTPKKVATEDEDDFDIEEGAEEEEERELTEDDVEVIDDAPDDAPDDAAEDDTGGDKSEDGELVQYSSKVQKRIKELTARHHNERRSKEAAMRELEELARVAKFALDENNRLKDVVNKGETFWKESNKSRIEVQLGAARRNLQAGMEEGDYERATKAQEELTKLSVQMERNNSWSPKPLERNSIDLARYVQPDQKAMEWRARNPWFDEDPVMQSFAFAMHRQLVGVDANGYPIMKDGRAVKQYDPRSDEYYEALDAEVRRRFPEKFGKSRTNGNGAPTIVGRPSRNGKAPQKVMLTKSQMSLAKRLGLSPKQYADEVLRDRDDR